MIRKSKRQQPDSSLRGADGTGRLPVPARLLPEAQPATHPLAPVAGSYDDEPLWQEFIAQIRGYRQELNAHEDESG